MHTRESIPSKSPAPRGIIGVPPINKESVVVNPNKIGEGAFGIVLVGSWSGTQVAIKVPRDAGTVDVEVATLMHLRQCARVAVSNISAILTS